MTVRVEGVIVRVLETWPLQLEVESDGKRVHVALEVTTRVLRGGTPVEASALAAGTRARFKGARAGPGALNATEIDLL